MAQISREEVIQIAALARLKLSDEEIELFQAQLGKILAHFQALAEVDTSQVSTAEPFISGANNWREDEPHTSTPAKEALKNAPDQRDGFFVVPKILNKN